LATRGSIVMEFILLPSRVGALSLAPLFSNTAAKQRKTTENSFVIANNALDKLKWGAPTRVLAPMLAPLLPIPGKRWDDKNRVRHVNWSQELCRSYCAIRYAAYWGSYGFLLYIKRSFSKRNRHELRTPSFPFQR